MIRVKRGRPKERGMARTGWGRPDDDPDLDVDDLLAEPRPPRRASRPSRRSRTSPVRPWDAADGENPSEEWDDAASTPRRSRLGRTPVYWRARDSLYFEPLIALAIVVLLLVGLFAYTQSWPPAYVVESNSMQHGPNDVVGVINAGDMVLSEKVPNSSIVPYVTGYRDGVSTYGEFGDVLLYHANGNQTGTPIIHRALLYLQWDRAKNAYNVTDLRGLPCGDQSNLTSGELYYSTNGNGHVGTGGCGTTNLSGQLELFHVGWNSKRVNISLASAALGGHSGFLTMGDNNSLPDQSPYGGGSTPVLSSLVEPGWILGVARGMVPWFGAIKLLLQGGAGNVSSGSWQFLGLSLVAIILAAFGIHYALRQEGIETPLRRREEEEAAAELDVDESGPPHGLFGSIRAWRSRSDDDDDLTDDESESPRARRRSAQRPPRSPPDDPRGRPRPRVHRPHRRRRDDDGNL
jgi:signal peptidase I